MSVRERVRAVFLAPKPAYAVAETAAVLGWSASEIAEAIAGGQIETTETAEGVLIEWQEVAVMLTSQYPQAAVEEALGAEITSVMPELVRLSELRVQIPRYQTAMLHNLAERERITVDEFVTRHFLDLASAEGDWLNERISGFGEALRWPQL